MHLKHTRARQIDLLLLFCISCQFHLFSHAFWLYYIKHMNKHVVIVPAYNEEALLPAVIAGIRTHLPEADIVVVDDGSTDSTSMIAANAGVCLIRHPCNLGYGAALQTGFRFAALNKYAFVITMDSDGQHDPSSAKNLVAAWQTTGADMIIGSRFLVGRYDPGIMRRIGILLFSRIARLCTGIRITDPTSGFLLLGNNIISYLAKEDNYPVDYPDINIILTLHQHGFSIIEAPVTMLEKPHGKSMHSGLRPIIYMVRMLFSIILILLGAGGPRK